jgi:Complex 1 protein (LYR family)
MHPVAQRVQLLRLYKQILRNAAVFPSIKRKEMYEAIRIEVSLPVHQLLYATC